MKTNIGHLEAAAGIAGLLKVLLAMRAGVLPPTLHLRHLNPHVRLAGTPFELVDRARPWAARPAADGRPVRRAGISSFGFGGTNAHVVLEAPAGAGVAPDGDPEPVVLVVAARDDAGLRAYLTALADHLVAWPDTDLARVAYTLQVGRVPARYRAAVVAIDRAEAIAGLRAVARGEACPGGYRGEAGETAGLLPLDASRDAVAAAWVMGAEVPWAARWAGRIPGRTPLPAAPLRTRPYWFDGRGAQPAAVPAAPPTEAAEEDTMRDATPVPEAHQRAKLRLAPLTRAARPPEPAAAAVTTAAGPVVAAALAEPIVAAEPVVAAARADVVAVARRHLADILGVSAQAVAPDQTFTELGLDSIFRMDLARRLNAELGLAVQAAELYEHDSLDRLATHLAVVGMDPAAPAAAPPALAEPPAPALEVPPALAEPLALEEPLSLAEPLALEEPVDTTDVLRRLVERVIGRPLDPARRFADDGLTSFDMLRTVSLLERRFGGLPKTLLFDQPTVAELAGYLAGRFRAAPAAQLLAAALADEPVPAGPLQLGTAPAAQPALSTGAEPAPPARSTVPVDGTGPIVVRKRELARYPDLAATFDRIDREHGREGGLAGRDIAPLAFVGAGGRAYLNFSRRGGDLFAWSYAGSAADFPVVVGEWLRYGERHDLRPNVLAMSPLAEADGVALTATPFGAVQRMTNLAGFSITGNPMARLRSQVRHFERAGTACTVEYRPGTEPAVDAEIAGMVGRWGDAKQMVNPYVAIVRGELGRGVLAERHRLFLTRLDGELASVVIVTRLPAEPGSLLDLEFYPATAPRGGLEYAIVRILERLRDEGDEVFSFGASFGVVLGRSPNAAPEVVQGLAELASVGIFGTGNFQFKNKFRPENLPIYLCQRADAVRTTVADVILMIADPDPAADAPELLGSAVAPPLPSAPPAPSPPRPPSLPASPPAPSAPTTAASAGRAAQLAGCGYNPLALRHRDVELDLLTDSWAELALAAIAARTATLAARPATQPPSGVAVPDWLPFEHTVATASGRAAEALLCRTWPRPRGPVIHNGLFPTWSASLADAGFATVATGTRAMTAASAGGADAGAFPGDLDLDELRVRLAAGNGGTAFVGVELSGNAGGGYPVSVANLRAVQAAARRHGVPLGTRRHQDRRERRRRRGARTGVRGYAGLGGGPGAARPCGRGHVQPVQGLRGSGGWPRGEPAAGVDRAAARGRGAARAAGRSGHPRTDRGGARRRGRRGDAGPGADGAGAGALRRPHRRRGAGRVTGRGTLRSPRRRPDAALRRARPPRRVVPGLAVPGHRGARRRTWTRARTAG